MCSVFETMLIIGGLFVFAVFIARVGFSKQQFENARKRSFLSLYVLYPLFLWVGPPLAVVGGVGTLVICVL
ncbi:MAG TPA: hypothetical protein VLC50_05050 [Actinomycetes bacterium]|nr:hypothetical protein [Actinomycetes bacterium]